MLEWTGGELVLLCVVDTFQFSMLGYSLQGIGGEGRTVKLRGASLSSTTPAVQFKKARLALRALSVE